MRFIRFIPWYHTIGQRVEGVKQRVENGIFKCCLDSSVTQSATGVPCNNDTFISRG